ncbi:MAG: hydroxysqualene dehydroxylase HpnE [Nocardiopsaceae bacterium]|jgi:squalene-associated FAD-dependent desaturase|nr:hydroxysqualene dehydroxylase HpnE [Nocardiopsaceae bacterium]
MSEHTSQRVVVIGGGLAGIRAAIGLRDAGVEVTLVEARPRLGGAASSYARGGMTIDNGQHVFLRCCASYQELLERLDATGLVSVQERFDVTVLSPRGTARLRRTGLPGPLQFGKALAGYRLLSLTERIKIARAALAMRFLDPADPALDRTRLGDWLAAKSQSESARRLMWDLFIVSALNIAGDDASLPLSATVIKMALLGERGAADIGIASVPLGDVHGRAAADLLGRLGARVMYGSRAAAIEPLASGGFRVRIESAAGGTRLADGNGSPTAAEVSELVADGVVLAVPASQARRLAGPAGISAADRWDDLGSSPIVNIHVIYDRQITSLPFAAAVESPVQWVFDKTRQAGLAAGQYLAVSLSAADSYVDVPAASLRDQFLPALEQLFPAAAGASVTDFFVTRERRATFRQSPGTGALRPGTATSVPGLVLAGAWTDTGWPDTMEGAVRSGQHAAEKLISELNELPRGATGGRPPGPTPVEAGVVSSATTPAETKAAS